MRIAIDPFMHRHLSLEELPFKAKELGYDWIELSPRGDFLEWFKAPRVYPERMKSFKNALKRADVGIASLLPMYRWASNDEVERLAAVRHWKRAIEIAVEMQIDTMNSEFGRGPHPDKGSCYCCHTGSMVETCEDAWWRSMAELVPIFEREGINLHIEPHPEDWCETLQPAVDIIRTVNSPRVKFLYCAPHTFYFGDNTKAMLRECADVSSACPRWRHVQPQGVFWLALYPESARHKRQSAPTSQYRPRRGAVGRLFRYARRNWLRRHNDLLRLRLGRQGG
jgi:myo-inositol catabolism protein IolH